MHRNELENYLADLLQVARYEDYCPNGLQVEGRPDVRRLVTGVTASSELIDAAIGLDADALLVHHGYFWRGEDPRVVGVKRGRLERLLRHGLNLFAFHLPLDAHAELGNNAQLAGRLGLTATGRFGDQDLGHLGVLSAAVSLSEFAALVGARLGRAPLVVGDGARPVRRVAWCTGAAQDLLLEAAGHGVDAYLTGEVSERTVLEAREAGVAFVSAGHHATERFGVQALGRHLADRFGLWHEFVDVPNPV
ncbi:MAG: Nif3-like dinuclear metal center hexameric protein [Pseudomonadota bacterium]